MKKEEKKQAEWSGLSDVLTTTISSSSIETVLPNHTKEKKTETVELCKLLFQVLGIWQFLGQVYCLKLKVIHKEVHLPTKKISGLLFPILSPNSSMSKGQGHIPLGLTELHIWEQVMRPGS